MCSLLCFCNYISCRIGWVDGWHRTMFSCDPDGNHVTAKDVSKETSHQPIFGIAASHSGNTFISDWTGRVLSIISNSNQTVSEYGQFGSRVMYGLVYADEQFQQQGITAYVYYFDQSMLRWRRCERQNLKNSIVFPKTLQKKKIIFSTVFPKTAEHFFFNILSPIFLFLCTFKASPEIVVSR